VGIGVRREKSGAPTESAPPEHESESGDDIESLRRRLDAQRRELGRLQLELARKTGYAEALQAQINVQTFWDEDLRLALDDVQNQLAERDEEIEALRGENEWRRGTEAALRAEVEWRREVVEDLQENLRQVKAARSWRWGQRYRRLKGLLFGGSGR
jgi:chromosome segregation ATPase